MTFDGQVVSDGVLGVLGHTAGICSEPSYLCSSESSNKAQGCCGSLERPSDTLSMHRLAFSVLCVVVGMGIL